MRHALERYAEAARPGASEREEQARRLAPLVVQVARRIARRLPPGIELDELVSAGAEGLLEALDRFDPSRGVELTVFAEWRIKGAILDALRGMDTLSRRRRVKAQEMERVRRQLESELLRPPRDDELARALRMDAAEMRELEEELQPAVFLPLDDLAPALFDSAAPDPMDLLAHRERVERVAAAVRRLPERLQHLLGLYYEEELTYREIADLLGVSEPRVCQLHGDAMRKLRELLRGDGE